MRVASSLCGVIALLGAAAAACGGGDEENLGVNNVSPSGSVGGLVVDAATNKPMQGVKVTVIAGGKIYPSADKPATTDATGYFAVDGVPSGDLLVRITPSDSSKHNPVTIAETLANAAGDFPLANATLSLGPIGLVPLADKSSAFKVQLITPDGAAPTAGVKGFLHAPVAYVDFNSNTIKPVGSIVVETSTNSSGYLIFEGMPDYAKLAGLVGSSGISDYVRVRIPPTDVSKDGTIDFLGKEESYNVNRLKGTVPIMVLSSSSKPSKLIIEAASVAALAGQQGNRMINGNHISGTIFASFNLPVIQSLTEVRLYNELGAALVPPPTATVTGNTLTVKLSTLVQGAEYNLSLRTFAKVEGIYYEGVFGAPFFTPPNATQTFAATMSRDSSNTSKIIVTFNQPIGTGVADKHLSGSNAVLFFDYDIDGSGVKGDAASERNATSSNVTLYINETDPPGPAGKSGLSTKWYFTLPTDASSTPIPANTSMDMVFSRSSAPVQQANGKLVADLKNLAVPF